MSDINYSKLGFKCGIEIHQQLDTGKLFCSCPSLIRDDEPDVRARRKMRAVAGELGEVDRAAAHEQGRDLDIIYEAYSDSTCLVELDEEPPHPLNSEALAAVLTVAALLEAKPASELWIMRKTVVDGSNTTGFQRTMLVATDGVLAAESGSVGIPTICLEEDAARKISEEGGVVTYRLDRLGIPLIELATDASIKSPRHAREVAEKIGLILRATGKVKRGLGTIRQDINISIAEGARVEVKGVQDLRLVAKVAEGEVARQLMLLELIKELTGRGVKDSQLKADIVDVTPILKKSDSKIVKGALKDGAALAVKLPCFAGLLKNRLGPELAAYARAKTGIGGVIHSDELPGYGITEAKVKELKNKLKLKESDALVLALGGKTVCGRALKVVVERARLALSRVPEETRRPREDGSTVYMRPLPGADRMYPETDEPPVPLAELFKKVSKSLPELPDESEGRYEKLGLSGEQARQLVRSRKSKLFDEVHGAHPNLKASFIASTLLSAPKEAKKRYGAVLEALTDAHLREVLKLVSEGVVPQGAVVELLAECTKSPTAGARALAEEKNLTLLPESDLINIINNVVKENQDLIGKAGAKAAGALLGKVMAASGGRADPALARKLLEAKI